jgi:PAS domain S-box-containing protein
VLTPALAGRPVNCFPSLDGPSKPVALVDSNEPPRPAVPDVKLGLWDWDLRTKTIYFSPECKRQIGYEDHEITNDFDEWQSRVHPAEWEDLLRTLQAHVAKSNPEFEVEFRLRHRDGSYPWVAIG